jgi:ribosomal protein L7/L12
MSHKREQILRAMAFGVSTENLEKIAEHFPHLIDEARREMEGEVEYVMVEKRPNLDQLDKEQRDSVVALVHGGRKIDAIKKARELTGCGLKEAYEFVNTL